MEACRGAVVLIGRRERATLLGEALREALGLDGLVAERRVPRAMVEDAPQDPLEVAVVERSGHVHPREPDDDVPLSQVLRAVEPDEAREALVVALDFAQVGVVHLRSPRAR
jgi:hypothetical protein